MFTTLFLIAWLLDPSGLGHDDFYVREATQARILALGEAGRPVVLLGARNPDCEVRSRCRAIGEALDGRARQEWLRKVYGVLREEGFTAVPMIDALPHEWPDYWGVVNTHRAHAREEGVCWSAPEWRADRRGTELYVLELRDRGWYPGEVRAMLRLMVAREEKMCSDNRNWTWFGRKPLKPVGRLPLGES